MTTALQHIAHLYSNNSGLAFFDGFAGTNSFDHPKTGSIRFRDLAPKPDARPVKCRLTGLGPRRMDRISARNSSESMRVVMGRLQKDPEIDALRGDAFILRLCWMNWRQMNNFRM